MKPGDKVLVVRRHPRGPEVGTALTLIGGDADYVIGHEKKSRRTGQERFWRLRRHFVRLANEAAEDTSETVTSFARTPA